MVETRGVCERCGYAFDSASHVEDDEQVPEIGDVTVCLQCGQPMIFEADGPRRLGDGELRQLDHVTHVAVAGAMDVQRRADPKGWWAEHGDT